MLSQSVPQLDVVIIYPVTSVLFCRLEMTAKAEVRTQSVLLAVTANCIQWLCHTNTAIFVLHSHAFEC